MHQGHRVLKLISEAVGATRLVIAATTPYPRRECLVDEPSIGEHVEGDVGSLQIHRSKSPVPVRPYRFQCLAGATWAGKTLHQILGFVPAPRRSDHEHHFPLLAVRQFDHRLHRGARIESRAGSSGQSRAAHGRGISQGAVATYELGTVPRYGASRLACLRKDDPLGPLSGIGVECEQRAAVSVFLSHDVHEIGMPPLAQDQLPVSSER